MKAESDNIQDSQMTPSVSAEDGEEWMISFWVSLQNILIRWPLYNCAISKAADSIPDLTSQVRLLDEKLQPQHCRVCSIGANAERVAEGHPKIRTPENVISCSANQPRPKQEAHTFTGILRPTN